MTKSMKAKIKSRMMKAKPRAPHIEADDDPVPENIDEFRIALAQRIMTFLGQPRVCRVAICKRTKRCSHPTLRCQRDFPEPPMTLEQKAKVLADFQDAIRQQIAERGE